MTPLRRTAFLAGLLFIITFVTSIPAVLLYRSVVNHANYKSALAPTPALPSERSSK